jgi:transposase
MTFETEAASMTREELLLQLRDLQESHDELARRVAWFERQLFGTKSERRLIEGEDRQLTLGEIHREREAREAAVEVPAHRRRKGGAKKPDEGHLRFGPMVPVEEILLGEPKDPEKYYKVSEKVTLRLAQRPASYVLLRYVRPVYKRKSDGEFSCSPAPPAVLERSFADVSFLAGLLIEKFVYHLPLHRQHQRLEAADIHVTRSTLTNLVHRTADLLEPVYAAQLRSILSSQVLAMDETPIKAGRRKRGPPQRGAMKTAYFWPLYGDQHEIAFPFATTRGSAVVREALKDFGGVLLTDGYEVYERYVDAVNRIVHAQCWAHTRRYFVKAEEAEPTRAGEALALIGKLYEEEEKIRSAGLESEKVLAARGEKVKPVVDGIFAYLTRELATEVLLPTNPFTKAARYALNREKPLRVFLEYPDVPPDTNHLERAIRPIAVGRKNWMFCWTELGAEYVGIIQSLLSTCRVQGIDPYTYLVDILQRIDTHPAREVELLTPRIWKKEFGENPLRSDLDRVKPEIAYSLTP